jgi:lysophospholipase L1-like esterase
MVQETQIKPITQPVNRSRPGQSKQRFPWGWFSLSLVSNLLLGSTLLLWFFSDRLITSDTLAAPEVTPSVPAAPPKPDLPGERKQLTYQQWVALLDKEAKATVKAKPDHLMVLAGDSISLWFPTNLLPTEQTWLNQSISGETATGLLRRLSLFSETQPNAIFVMIGINDLVKGSSDQQLIDNYWSIIQRLKEEHPNARIVVQSILPHGGDRTTSEKREKLLTIPISRIFQLNTRLSAIAKAEGISFLDLQPLFADESGYLRSELSTDGLHLSKEGYLVWRSAIQTFNQLSAQSTEAK